MPRCPLASRAWLAALAAAAGCASGPAPVPAGLAPETVVVRVDADRRYQAIEGFGASVTEHIDLRTKQDLMGALRPRVIEALFGRVGVNLGQLEVGPYERFDAARYLTANDDGDPGTFDWSGFNFVRSDAQKALVVDLAKPFGFSNFTLHGGTNVRWSDPWMAEVRRKSYRAYLDEMAENVVAPLVYWRDRFGIVPPRWHHLFNEPTSGNTELATRDVREVVDIVKAVGERLRREGFGHLRLVVASEETEEASLATARAVLEDPEARRYVGAISYHPYPYGSTYSDVGNVLRTSGAGRPDERAVRVRSRIAALASAHGLQVWMTEVSHGGVGSVDAMLGRAIHIHDELRYAHASAFWAMFTGWDDTAPRGTCDEDCLVHFDRTAGTVRISGTGYALGHYARWVRPGAARVASDSADRLVLATAFRDDEKKTLSFVVINNRRESAAVALHADGVALAGAPRAERSSAEGYWQPAEATLGTGGALEATLPPRSVTSLSVGFR